MTTQSSETPGSDGGQPAVPTFDGYDPFSPAYLRDPQLALQPALADTPVFFHAPLGCFVVTRYEDARAILKDVETFSSRAYKSVPVSTQLRDRIPEEYERAGQVVTGGQILIMDPPAHTQQRKAAQQTFTRPRIVAASDEIEAKANALIDEFAERGSCDLMQDFAYKLTLSVVGELVGLPPEHLPRFQAWIADVFGLMAPIDAKPGEHRQSDDELVAAYQRMYDAYTFFSGFVAERRNDPQEDLASAMLRLRDEDGEPLLSDDAVLAHMVGIIAAGTDTTANLIGNIVRYLTAEPAALAALRADESLWPSATEEGLRRAAIAPNLFRLTTRDTQICGVQIPARSMVAVHIGAANADPTKFPDPLKFDVRRDNVADNLALGIGRHFCLGAPLARPEATIALRTLYGRLPGLTADLDQELEFVPALTVRGILHQNISW